MNHFVQEVGDEINSQVAATSAATTGARAAAIAAAAAAKAAAAAMAPGTTPAPTITPAAALTAAIKGGCRVCVRYGLTGKLEPKEFTRYFCSMAFHPISAEAAITEFERYVRFATAYNVTKSINRSQAAALIASPDLKDRLYHLTRILEFPIPIKMSNGSISKLKEGLHLNHTPPGAAGNKAYYCGPDVDMSVSLADAKKIINLVFKNFGWNPAHPQSKTHAIARLLTPYCQGIMGYQAKSPLWIFQANRSRTGKDYLAAVTPLVFAGTAYEDAPLDKDDAENKRRITSAILAGQRFMHFANCKLDLDQCPSLEAAVTAKFWHDRIIGTSETVKMANEVIYSLSYNGPLKMSEDMINRTRRIKLAMPVSTAANSRSYPDLHKWLSSDDGRRRVIAALQALVDNWIDTGQKPGTVKFTSFPEWAAVVGGIMEAAGYDNPCRPDPDDIKYISRSWYDDICDLADKVAKAQPGVPLDAADITKNYVKKDTALSTKLKESESEESYKRELGRQLNKHAGSDLGGGVWVEVDLHSPRRPKYKFHPATATGSATAAGSTPAAGSAPASPTTATAAPPAGTPNSPTLTSAAASSDSTPAALPAPGSNSGPKLIPASPTPAPDTTTAANPPSGDNSPRTAASASATESPPATDPVPASPASTGTAATGTANAASTANPGASGGSASATDDDEKPGCMSQKEFEELTKHGEELESSKSKKPKKSGEPEKVVEAFDPFDL